MDFKKHIVRAWELTWQFIVSLVLMTLVMCSVAVITLGVLASVTMAGYMQSILLMIRQGREPKIQDLFSEMRLFLPLLAFGIVAFVAVMIGFMLLIIPGILAIVATSFCCLYMLPLMTDKKLGLFEAIKQSYNIAVRDNIGERHSRGCLVPGNFGNRMLVVHRIPFHTASCNHFPFVSL